jgi:hypothetical protein
MGRLWCWTPIALCFLVLSGCSKSVDGKDSRKSSRGSTQDLDHHVFVTSSNFDMTLYPGDPDGFCQDVADAAGLESTYIAMVSNATEDLKDRIISKGGIVYVSDAVGDRVTVVEEVDDLWNTLSVDLLHAIDRDENGNVAAGNPLTGTGPTGVKADNGSDYCDNWQNGGAALTFVGSSSTTNATYIQTADATCSGPLFCIQQ